MAFLILVETGVGRPQGYLILKSDVKIGNPLAQRRRRKLLLAKVRMPLGRIGIFTVTFINLQYMPNSFQLASIQSTIVAPPPMLVI